MGTNRTLHSLWAVAAIMVILAAGIFILGQMTPKAQASGEIGRYQLSCATEITRLYSYDGKSTDVTSKIICKKIDTVTGSYY